MRMLPSIVSVLAWTATLGANEIYFPPADGSWETITAAEVGWSASRVDAALDFAFERKSSDVVVLVGGRILAERSAAISAPSERYEGMLVGHTADGRPIEDVASVQKSVASFLAGIARGRGKLDLEQSVSHYLGAGWSHATPEQERAVTVRHIMSMASGLSADGRYEVAAGSRWRYNTNVYSRLVKVLERTSGMSVNELTAAWLTAPIGMSDSRWEPRDWLPADADANRIGFASTARDLARFGLLILNRGRWRETDLLGDPDYLALSLSPSQRHNPAYGLLWWLNGQDASLSAGGASRPGPLVPTAPDDMVAAYGALGRKVYVVPSLDLVVTRVGDDPGRDFDREIWQRLMAAAPAGAAEQVSRGEWRYYGGDAGNRHYSPLGQIDRATVGGLVEAWRWQSIDNELILSGDSAYRRSRFEGTPLMVEGVLYLSTALSRAVALDARTGEPVAGFGTNGRVDLTAGLRREVDRRFYQVTSPLMIGPESCCTSCRCRPRGGPRP